MKTYSLNEAVALLRCHPETLRTLSKQGIAPGRKVGRGYVILASDLAAYIRGEYVPRGQAAVESEGTTTCPSINQKAVSFGTLTSRRVSRLDERPVRTFDEAALRWLKEQAHKSSIKGDESKNRRLRPFFTQVKLHKITSDLCKDAIFKAAPSAGKATHNRYLALLRALLRKAEQEWGWIEKAPHLKLFHEATCRIRWITQEEAQKLISYLPKHLVPVVQIALSTGLRRSNAYGLRWSQINLERKTAWIHPDQAKARRAIGVPLNNVAMDAILSQQGKDREFVFTFRGKPLTGVSDSAFKKACKLAGIHNFRFHDLRHTWASWLIQSGVGLAELQKLGGWGSISMVMRYAHRAPDHLRKHTHHIDSLMANFSHTKKMYLR
ncbi:tyrosine-type recombinase/integrase [Chitinimonas sp. PSY-7]|uniref:tyrosine-type recombinase/integrase n=1 Tax=Chitinimonas sp. PSY-7 TaxID=3459088 RepID=UPI0040403EED